MINRLSGNVVKVDNMTDGMKKAEEESCTGNNFVELDVGIEGNVLLDGVILKFGQQVPGHSQQ